MKPSKLFGPAAFFLVSFGLTIAVLAATRAGMPVPAEPLPARPKLVEPAAYAAAAAAFSAGDLTKVEAALDERAGDDPSRALETRILLGLYAHSAGHHELAVTELQSTHGYRGELEDWRLWALANSAVAAAEPEIAHRAFETLIHSWSRSPLAGPAIVRAAEQAAEREDWQAVLAAQALAEEHGLDHSRSEALALLSWQAAEALATQEILPAAARRLLVNHPLRAAELGVLERWYEASDETTLTALLTPADLLARAESLISVELPEAAIETLAEIPDGTRNLDWALVQATALTAAQRGEEALALLASVDGDPATDVRIEWARARAALEAATPRRERRHLSADDRAALRARAHHHLRATAELSEDSELAIRALRLLFTELLDEERFEDALAVLVRLQEIDPADMTGARSLWRTGWGEYSDRNYSGAVGYWAELAELYPRSNYTRAGLYWSGRAHERLGNRDRAQALYHQVSEVDFTDLYRRHALERLAARPADSAPSLPPTEPWPSDPLLDRCERLHRLALHDLALIELEELAGADKRSRSGLRARILAASGDRRGSIIALRSTFPLLGTPHQNLTPPDARELFYPLDFGPVIEKHAARHELSPQVVFGMIRQESAFDAGATSWAGARGLMQIMPSTARELAGRMGLPYSAERLSDPEFSIALGTRYFRQMLDIFDGNDVLALAGYNAGPYRIKRLWRQAGGDAELDHFVEHLTLEETKWYVKRVLLYTDSYLRLYDSAS